MTKVVYSMTPEGEAHSLMFVEDNYVLDVDEQFYEGEIINMELPNLSSLHSPVYKLESQWQYIRDVRDRGIASIAWILDRHVMEQMTVGKTPTLTDAEAQEWLQYVQALRDITKNQTDPYNIVWPTPPTTVKVDDISSYFNVDGVVR